MNGFRNISTLALNTCREALRGKLFTAVLFASVIVVGAASLFGTVTIGDQVKVIKDFGLFCVSLMSAAFIVIVGASLLHKELERKTIYNILSKAVERRELLIGKYLGMLATSAALAGAMGLALICFAGLFEGGPDWNILASVYFTVLEGAILCAAAILFSSIVVTPIISGMLTFAIFIAGRSAGYLAYFTSLDALSAPMRALIRLVEIILPRLDRLNHGADLVYGITPSPAEFFWSLAYSAGYASVLLIISTLFFSRREFN